MLGVPTVRLHGSLIAYRWTRSQPTDVVEVTAAQLSFAPWLRKNYTLMREDVAHVDVKRVRIPPFWWATDLTFVLDSGEQAPKLFRPIRPKHAISVLREFGWPVSDG